MKCIISLRLFTKLDDFFQFVFYNVERSLGKKKIAFSADNSKGVVFIQRAAIISYLVPLTP